MWNGAELSGAELGEYGMGQRGARGAAMWGIWSRIQREVDGSGGVGERKGGDQKRGGISALSHQGRAMIGILGNHLRDPMIAAFPK
jgi:hypothetical protein